MDLDRFTKENFLNLTIRFSKDVVFRDLDDEMIIMDMNTGKYFGLNETGAKIWALLDKYQKPKKVIDELLTEYNLSEDECEREVKQFLQAILNKGLIDVEGHQ